MTRSARLLIVCIVCFMSCRKPASEPNIWAFLQQNRWYLDQVQIVKKDIPANVILSDSIFLSVSCSRQSVYTFMPDDSCTKLEFCGYVTEKLMGGHWYLGSDSLFFANIPVQRIIAGSVITLNNGIPISKFLAIGNDYFKVQTKEQWIYGGSTVTPSQNEIIKTYTFRKL